MAEPATLKHTMVYSWELFYEPQPDGTRILRHIRVNNAPYEVPADGITIDGLPADTVGSKQIIDKSIQTEDLAEGIQETLNKAGNLALASESDVRAIVAERSK